MVADSKDIYVIYKNIADVVPGDVIIEGGNKTAVTKVDVERCKGKVHINDRDCYEGFTSVRVQESSKKD